MSVQTMERRNWWDTTPSSVQQMACPGVVPLTLAIGYGLVFALVEYASSGVTLMPGIAVWYLQNGLTLALLLLAGQRAVPLAFIAYLSAALIGYPGVHAPLAAFLLALTSTLAVTAMARVLVVGLRVDPRLPHINDVVAFAVTAVAGCTLAAALWVTVLASFDLLPWADFFHAWVSRSLADGIGIVVVTPLVMTLVRPRLDASISDAVLPGDPGASAFEVSRWELSAQIVVLAGVLWIVFFMGDGSEAPPGHLCFLPIIWVALRYGLKGATAVSLILSCSAILALQLKIYPMHSLREIQILMVTLAFTGLFLGAVVTQRRKAEEMLGVEKAYLEQLFFNAPEAIVVVDNESRILRANPEFTSMFGFERNEVLGRKVDELIVPAGFRDEALTVTGKIMNEESVSLETVRQRKDGTLLNVSILGTPIHVRGGRVAVYGIYRDITHRRELEDQLRQSQKMEAVGRLAGGVAHDFNNLLTAILGYSELLIGETESSSGFRRYVEEIRKAADRAKSLTSQLLAFSRKQILTPQILDLTEVVRNIQPMLTRLLGEDVVIETLSAEQLGKIKADPGQIEQVIVNLAVNARDAMPQGGRISVRLRETLLDEDYSHRHRTLPGSYVILEVADTGTGMSEDVRKRIFEPFFTTKEQGKGTGLGLATVYGIVKQSGGHIEVESEPGKGATFRIFFPVVAETAAVPRTRTNGIEEGTATILVVEDEAGIRNLISEILRRAGYNVLEARHGTHALLLAESHGGAIQLLLTDVVMPEMSGRELAQRLEAQRASIRVLFMSGYTDDAILQHGVASQDSAFLQKPFTPETLLARVHEALHGKQLN